MDSEEGLSLGCMAAFFFLLLSCFPAWITHVLNTIQDEQWVLLVVGALFWPVGVVHGWGIWFGFF